MSGIVAVESARLAGRAGQEIRERARGALENVVERANPLDNARDTFSQWGSFLFDRVKAGVVNWYVIQIGIVLIVLGLVVILWEPLSGVVGGRVKAASKTVNAVSQVTG